MDRAISMMMDADDVMVLVKHLEQTAQSFNRQSSSLSHPSSSYRIILQNSKSFDKLNIIGISVQPLEIYYLFYQPDHTTILI